MTNKFSAHDIVIDKDGFEGRIYRALDLGGSTPSYDVVFTRGHAVRNENELTMVRKYVKTEWNEELGAWVTK